jgi:hypothetical protein
VGTGVVEGLCDEGHVCTWGLEGRPVDCGSTYLVPLAATNQRSSRTSGWKCSMAMVRAVTVLWRLRTRGQKTHPMRLQSGSPDCWLCAAPSAPSPLPQDIPFTGLEPSPAPPPPRTPSGHLAGEVVAAFSAVAGNCLRPVVVPGDTAVVRLACPQPISGFTAQALGLRTGLAGRGPLERRLASSPSPDFALWVLQFLLGHHSSVRWVVGEWWWWWCCLTGCGKMYLQVVWSSGMRHARISCSNARRPYAL